MRYIFCTHSEKAVPLHRNLKTIKINQNLFSMKKLLIFALCLLGICNARAEMMTAQEIILTAESHIQPWDSKDDETIIRPPSPTNFHASIYGDLLSIDASADEHAYVEVIDPGIGNVVADEEFIRETTIYIPQSGDYELYIYTESGIVLTGEFSVN